MATTIKISEEERLKLRNKAKAELERIEAVTADDNFSEKINKFKEKFGTCEMVYKVILDDHQTKKGKKKTDRLLITMTQVPFALEYAGYDFEKEFLDKLFGSEEKIGQRSVKKLRDSLTHSMNQNAINELIEREEELHGYMDQFLAKIREFDS